MGTEKPDNPLSSKEYLILKNKGGLWDLGKTQVVYPGRNGLAWLDGPGVGHGGESRRQKRRGQIG